MTPPPSGRAVFPDAYERVLRIWETAYPAAAGRTRGVLAVLLGDRGPGGFGHSTLTLTGSPFEPACSLGASGLRYTVDSAPPGLPEARRLSHALVVLQRLRAPAPDADLVRRLAELQASGPLRFGAHIGVRHDDTADRYKLYVELPREAAQQADALVQAILGSKPVLNVPGRDARPALVGLDLASGGLEFYYRIENLHPLEIGTLLSRVGQADRAQEVLAMVSATQPTPIRHALPGATWGFSYVAGEATFSLYSFARTLFGPDGWARAAILAMARRHGWDLGSYEAISAPLAQSRAFVGHHGIFGLVARAAGAPAPWIGFAPVAGGP